MQQHKESHLDHGLSPAVVDYIFKRFADRTAFFIETFELPEEYGTVPCGLYGPIMGDDSMHYWAYDAKRGNREYTSRVISNKPARQVRMVTVIAGPHDGLSCILYTAFGGPITPKEPNDPTLAPDKREESEKFWREHALVL